MVRPGAYHRVKQLIGPALPVNIRLGLKDLSSTKTLAYYEYLLPTEEKVL